MPARSIPEIITDLLSQMTRLLRQESQLARTEMLEKVRQLAIGLAMLVCGAVLLIPAVVILLQAGVSALITNRIVAEPWAPLILGGGAFVMGLILVLIGVTRFKAKNLVPNRTINQIHSDVSVARHQTTVTRDNYAQQRAA